MVASSIALRLSLRLHVRTLFVSTRLVAICACTCALSRPVWNAALHEMLVCDRKPMNVVQLHVVIVTTCL